MSPFEQSVGALVVAILILYLRKQSAGAHIPVAYERFQYGNGASDKLLSSVQTVRFRKFERGGAVAESYRLGVEFFRFLHIGAHAVALRVHPRKPALCVSAAFARRLLKAFARKIFLAFDAEPFLIEASYRRDRVGIARLACLLVYLERFAFVHRDPVPHS